VWSLATGVSGAAPAAYAADVAPPGMTAAAMSTFRMRRRRAGRRGRAAGRGGRALRPRRAL